MKKFALFLLPLFSWMNGLCQNTIGLPDIDNYSKQAYKGGAQNRQMRQDRKGVMYFANSEGVLTFNGIKWKTYPLPNNSIVRSIEFGPDNKMYVGGQDEFGYFSPNSNGQLMYHSMKDLIPKEERSFTDVWEIYFFKNLVFFQTSNKIFQISGNHCTVFKSTHWRFITPFSDKLIAQDFDKGLLSYQNGVWAPFITKSELPADYFATSLTMIGKDSGLLTTQKDGCYILNGTIVTKLKSASLEYIASKNISSSAMVNETHIALGTNLDGCFIINKKGNLVQSFSRKEGLQNNNILDVFLDKEKNLWLGLDDGIDFIAYNNAIKHIYPEYLNEGSGYASTIYDDELYIGTSNGLFKVPLYNEQDLSYIKGMFQPVPNTKGQVWNLSEVNGKLLLGHHDGAFAIENFGAVPIDKSSGFWTFLPCSNVLPSSIMAAGTYQGINFYSYKDGKFASNNLKAHFESARFVVMDNNSIWIAHPYKGIYRVQNVETNPTIKSYSNEGKLSINGNYVFKVKNRVVVTSENGNFEYDPAKDEFKPSDYFNQLFKGKKIRYLKEDNAGNIWFVFDKTIGVMDMQGKEPKAIYFPELTNKFVSGFEFIQPLNNNNIFIGGEKGFYHINYEQYKKIEYRLPVQITLVKAINEKDSLLYGGYANEVNDSSSLSKQGRTKISHSWNSFHFEFASPVYAQQSNIEYSYFLEGFDDKWSEFSTKTEKEYTNLPAGNYSFKVKVRNNLGAESEASSYNFTVLPPWYLSWWAYVVYICIFIYGNYLFFNYQKKKFRLQQEKHEEEQKRLQYLHQLELEKNEKEIIKLRNEKLEAEISHKNTELASTAMHLVQKGELLGKVKDQMIKMKKASTHEQDADVKKIIRTIADEDKKDEQWEQFAMHFDKVHSDFLVLLKAKHPNLTANELKLCAYLRMNLASKEIAQLMNISVRGVEISRYRLRKKLGVPTEVNLFDFLMSTVEEK